MDYGMRMNGTASSAFGMEKVDAFNFKCGGPIFKHKIRVRHFWRAAPGEKSVSVPQFLLSGTVISTEILSIKK